MQNRKVYFESSLLSYASIERDKRTFMLVHGACGQGRDVLRTKREHSYPQQERLMRSIKHEGACRPTPSV